MCCLYFVDVKLLLIWSYSMFLRVSRLDNEISYFVLLYYLYLLMLFSNVVVPKPKDRVNTVKSLVMNNMDQKICGCVLVFKDRPHLAIVRTDHHLRETHLGIHLSLILILNGFQWLWSAKTLMFRYVLDLMYVHSKKVCIIGRIHKHLQL